MSFSGPSRERSAPVLPLSAMVDMMFLLLIFFLTNSALREQDLRIEVATPAYEQAAEAVGGTMTTLTVTEEGSVYLGGEALDEETLDRRLRELAQTFPDEAVLVRGDGRADYEDVVRVIDIAHGAGIRNVSQAVSRPAE